MNTGNQQTDQGEDNEEKLNEKYTVDSKDKEAFDGIVEGLFYGNISHKKSKKSKKGKSK
ncbi:MAG TPA: hypothetical protein VFG90_01195 [Nitrososphaeraceae archaeon]|nr:hypothetical protein [Nitrososphaeraceae archaeon]